MACTSISTDACFAQDAPTRVKVRGFAYDSLHQIPLANAFITLVGTGRIATSNERGYFEIDSVPMGLHAFTVQHDWLDSLGLSGIRASLLVRNEQDTLHIATPSFRTLWVAACGTAISPVGTGFIYGLVGSAHDKRLSQQVSVDAQWLVVAFDAKQKGITRNSWGETVQSQADGRFAICGVPNDITVQVYAHTDSGETDTLNVVSGADGVRRLDLTVGRDASPPGYSIVVGHVYDLLGAPVSDAMITGTRFGEVRSLNDGRFVIRNIPTGSRQISARAVGWSPGQTTLSVASDDTTFVTVHMARLAVALDSVQVRAANIRRQFMSDLDSRRQQGFGRFLDSTVVARMMTVAGALVNVPQTKLKNGKIYLDNCLPAIFIDGRETDQWDLKLLPPSEIGVIEVYVRAVGIPVAMSTRRGSAPPCAIAVWTKSKFP
ncbi:MAG: carboxypeptidase-like regulatory domain-containing protein [Gemmatimonadaceae bacterium]